VETNSTPALLSAVANGISPLLSDTDRSARVIGRLVSVIAILSIQAGVGFHCQFARLAQTKAKSNWWKVEDRGFSGFVLTVCRDCQDFDPRRCYSANIDQRTVLSPKVAPRSTIC